MEVSVYLCLMVAIHAISSPYVHSRNVRSATGSPVLGAYGTYISVAHITKMQFKSNTILFSKQMQSSTRWNDHSSHLRFFDGEWRSLESCLVYSYGHWVYRYPLTQLQCAFCLQNPTVHIMRIPCHCHQTYIFVELLACFLYLLKIILFELVFVEGHISTNIYMMQNLYISSSLYLHQISHSILYTYTSISLINLIRNFN